MYSNFLKAMTENCLQINREGCYKLFTTVEIQIP